jgi:MFS family permease
MSELPSGFVATGRKQISRKRIESATTSEASSIYNGQPPDGGWGWVIVAASFAAHAIADGCICSFGVLFVELLDVFGESRATTAWIGSLFVAMPSVCAPIASVLTLRYGCRVTTIAGGFIAAIGCILSSFANSVGVLCFTFGVISGFGLALVFIPAVLIVAFYFEKRRAFATGSRPSLCILHSTIVSLEFLTFSETGRNVKCCPTSLMFGNVDWQSVPQT